MKQIKQFLLVVALFTVFANVGWGQLLQWNTYGNAGTETTEPSVFNNTNISAANLTMGTITAANNGNRFGGTGWWNTGNTALGNTLAEAIAGNDYIQFIVTPNTGFSFTPTSFVFQWQSSSTGPKTVTLRSSADSYAANLGTTTVTATIAEYTITISGLTNITTPTTFRLYGYGATLATGSGGFDVASSVVNVQLSGTTASTGNSAPTLTTQAVTTIGTTTATGNGSITATGGVNSTARGFCWDVYANPDPTITNSHTTESGDFGIASFTGSITGLAVETRYKVRAYATNTAGTGYGSAVNFWTFSSEPSAHSTTFNNTISSQTQINLTFDAASTITNADGYIILQKIGSTPSGLPTDGNAYTLGNTIGDGTVAAIINSTSTTTTSITGLSAGTTYYFTIIPYNYNGANNETYNYKIDGTIPGTNGRTYRPNDVDSYVSSPDVQINPLTISSLSDTEGEAIEVYKFKISDVGTDGLSTKVTQITINAGTNNNATWSSTIGGAKLSVNGGTSFVTTGTPVINASSIVFPITSGYLDVSNAGNVTVSLFVHLKSSGLTDKQIMEFNIPTSAHGFTADATASTFLTTFVSATTSSQITVDVTATKFNFSTQPANTTVNTNFSAGVEAIDANNNRDLDAVSVTLTTSSGTLSSITGLTQNTSNGLYSWTDLQNNTPGTSITLSAIGSLTTATSNAITVFSAKPTTQASAILFNNVSMTSMTVNWTNGNGANRIVVVKASGTPGTPVNGTTYSANTVFGNGGTFGAGEYVVYNGSGTTVDITGLTGSTTYTFKVFEYNGSAGTENYLTTSNSTLQTTTALIYYSTGSIDPTSVASWKTNRDGTGSSPSNFTIGETFVIQNTHSMTTGATWSISGTNSKLWIENGGTLTATSAITLATATTFQIDNGGTYIHSNTSAFGTTIFQGTESFASNSTVEFRDWNGTGPSVSSWGNVKFNATGTVVGSIQFSGGLTIINGNFEVIATGTGTVREIRLSSTTAYTLNIAGDLIISGGILNMMSGAPGSSVNPIINIGGNFNMTAGTFTAGTNTNTNAVVNFIGSGKTYNFSGGTNTNDKISYNINNGSSILLNNNIPVATGRSLTVLGTLDCGSVAVTGAGAFTLSDGATLKTSNATGFDGSILVSGTKSYSQMGNYEIHGASTGTLSTINNLTVNNSSGNVTLGSNLTVNGTLTFTNGKLNLGANNLTLGSSATVSGISASNYIVTNSTGVLTRNPAANTETLFPIGTADAYSPVWITNSGSTGDYTINVEPDVSGTNSGADRLKLKWNVNGPASSNTKLRVGWLTSQEGTNFTANRNTYAQLWHLYNNSWVTAGTANLAAGTGSELVDYTLYASGITTYSPFGSGLNESAMPVTLSSLTNSVTGRNIKLSWTTSSEINNAGFDVERSGNRQQTTGNWEKIGYVSGKGTTNNSTNYSFDDRNLQTGKYNYRLKQIDHNGNFEYFSLNGEVEVGVPAKFDLSQNYPNPFNPVTKINFDLPFDSKVNIALYDITGREVKSLVNEQKTAGYHTVQFNASDLSSGIYFYRIMTKSPAKDFVMTKKLALIK